MNLKSEAQLRQELAEVWGLLDAERAGRAAAVLAAAEIGSLREDNERLAREAHTWSKAAETYAAELERHKPLLQAVEWLLDDGHMNTEHLARLRAAWEEALGPNAGGTRLAPAQEQR